MTPEQVRDVFEYDPDTGKVRWKINPGGRAYAGAIAGTSDDEGYIVVRYRGRGYKAHRVAWVLAHGEWPRGVIDHVNGCKWDNRIENLRDVDHFINAQNCAQPNRNGRSGLRWVSWFSQYQKWKASFFFRKKHYFVGYFDDPMEAHLEAKRQRAALGAP